MARKRGFVHKEGREGYVDKGRASRNAYYSFMAVKLEPSNIRKPLIGLVSHFLWWETDSISKI